MRKVILSITLIPTLALLIFWPLVRHPSRVLYSDHSDMLAMHLPMKHFSVSSYQETGQLPLWCPYSFSGMPLVHDVQVAAFYPLHWPLYWMPSERIGAGLSWLVVIHVVIAGWGMLAYARWTGLGPLGAFVAAVGWMFAGKWMLHVLEGGHYILTPLAWLPFVLLLLGRATQSDRSVRVVHRLAWSAAGGVAFALMVLGTHPQVMFYSGIAIALASWLDMNQEVAGLITSIRLRRLAVCSGLGLFCAIIAVGIAAVQLLPAVEAAPYTSRAGGVPSSDVLMGGLRTLVNFVGPAIVAPGPNVRWEDRGGLALLWLLFAILAVALRKDDRVRKHTWLAAILILFALGGAVFVQWLPGFRLFRQPTRMMLIAALPIAWLAGAGVESLPKLTSVQSQLCRKLFVRLLIALGILSGGLAARSLLSGDSLLFHPYWISLTATVPLTYLLITRADSLPSGLATSLATALLLIDLGMLVFPAINIRALDEIYPETLIAKHLQRIAKPGERILERDESAQSLNAPLGTGAPLALLHRLEVVRGYNSFDVAAYRRYLKRISGDDSNLAPLNDPWTFPLIGNFPVRERRLLDLLGVRYLVQPANAEVQPGWHPSNLTERSPRAYNLIDGGVRAMDAYSVYENPQAFPRAFTVRQHDVRMDESGDLWLDRSLQTGLPSLIPAKLDLYSPNCTEIAVNAAEPCFLVLTDAWYPGWGCEVDGDQVPVLRAERLFCAIKLEPGEHQVVFKLCRSR